MPQLKLSLKRYHIWCIRNRSVRLVLLFVMLLLKVANAEEGSEIDLRLVKRHSGSYNYFRNKGDFSLYYLQGDNSGGTFGPITVWKPAGSSRLVQFSHSLSALDEALRVEAEAGNRRALNTIMEYLRLYCGFERSYLMLRETKLVFFKQLAKTAPEFDLNKLERLLPDPSMTVENETWELSFSLIMWGGAIEKRTYSGGLTPFSVKKEVVEVVAPVGFVPIFDYRPE